MSSIPVRDTVQRRAAATVRSKYEANVAAIRADRNLSQDGRRRRLAAELLTAKTKLDDLRAKERQTDDKRRDELERTLFAWHGTMTAAEAANSRDCAERADKIATAPEALAALRKADLHGDQFMARAIAERAREGLDGLDRQHWGSVLTAYAETRPVSRAALEELASIDETRATDDSIASRLSGETAYSVTRPPELAGANDWGLSKLAAEAGDYNPHATQQADAAQARQNNDTSDWLREEHAMVLDGNAG